MAHRFVRAWLFLALFVGPACWGAASSPPAPPSQSETFQLLTAGKFAELDRRFAAIQAAYRTGVLSDDGLRAAFRAFYVTEESLAPRYDAWVKQFPKSYVANLARGTYYKRLGLARRGTAFADQTSNAQFAGMRAAFVEAKKSLDASLPLDAKPLLSYLHLLDIVRDATDPAASRALLDRSLQIDPANIVIREKYMEGLRPRWGGTLKQMEAFLQEARAAGLAPERLRGLQSMVADERGYQQLYNANNPREAIKAYREAEAAGGEFCQACFAHALMTDKQLAEAARVYTLVIEGNPRDADSIARRGFVYQQLDKPSEAIADFKSAAEMGDANAQGQYGFHLMKGVPGVLQDDPEQGIEWLRKSAAQGNSIGRDYLAKVEKYMREHPEAELKPAYKRH